MIEVNCCDIDEARARIKAEKQRTIRFCDYTKLQKQLQQIEYEMTNNYTYSLESTKYKLHLTSKPPKHYFYLFGCECGVGKTYIVINKIIDYLAKYSANIYEESNRGMLFVMQNVDTLKLYKARLDFLLNNVYVETIDSSMKDGEIDFKLQTYPIIFVTHQMYKSLATNEVKRKQFSKGRNLLIIDEFINMCDIITLDKVKLEKLRAELKYTNIQEKFDNAISELKKYFEQLQTNGKDKENKLHIFNVKTKYQQVLKKFVDIKEEVKDSFDDKEKSSFYDEHNQSIFSALDDILEFYRGTCILERGILYTPRRRLDYWFLEKNIMLDASANINNAYKLREHQFKDMLGKDFKVLDHQKWTIELIEINTTSTTKRNYENFFVICNKILLKLGKRRTLVVTQKSECIDNEGNKITEYFDTPYLNYFQNMLGDNTYKLLQNVLIAHTFNLSEKQYILEYLYYSEKRLDSDEDIKVTTPNRRRRFSNEEIEQYKIGRIANEFYQAIKRVNRDMEEKTRAVIITKDVEAVKLVCTMLKNYTLIDTTDKYQIKYKEKENKELENNNHYDTKAIQIFNAIVHNQMESLSSTIRDNLKYINNTIILQKQYLRIELGIEYPPNLRREVFNKSNVKQFIKENGIIEETKKIIFKTGRGY